MSEPGHLPGDTGLTGRSRARKVVKSSSSAKKKTNFSKTTMDQLEAFDKISQKRIKAEKGIQSMDELLGPGWREKGVKKRKKSSTNRAVVKTKKVVRPKKKFVSKRVIKKAAPLTAKQKKRQAEARARKKRAMKVLRTR